MEEKKRQGPGTQVTSNTLKEEKHVASAHCGSSPGYKQEKFVEVGRNVATTLKSEVAYKDAPPETRGYPTESKLREIVNPEEPAAVRKEEGLFPAQAGNGDSSSLEQKLSTPFSGAAAADTPPKAEQKKGSASFAGAATADAPPKAEQKLSTPYAGAAAGDAPKVDEKFRGAAADAPSKEVQSKSGNDREAAKPPVATSQAACAASPPSEKKFQELPQNVAPTALNFKEDACGKEGCAPVKLDSPVGQSASAAKEEKNDKGPSKVAAANGQKKDQKEEKLQEGSPVATEVEMPTSSGGPSPSGSSRPSDAAGSPNCCSCF